MFSKIFIENSLKDNTKALEIINRFKNAEVIHIDKVEDIWGKVKRPYLQKREDLNLFLGEKNGQIVKEAPDAYGTPGAPHYYFIHAYNCIYECNYCYLQGYFNTPDIVTFLNHQDIQDQIIEIYNLARTKQDEVWFHAGEYSDSLALSHITGELDLYYDTFKKIPGAILELRTKSANIRSLLKKEPLSNVIISFSLSPKDKIKNNDLLTPGLTHRLKALKSLHGAGHQVALHFDPIIYSDNLIEEYQELLEEVKEAIPLHKIKYLSLGVVRFTKDVYYEVLKNYPESEFAIQDLKMAEDKKMRYPRAIRMWILGSILDLCISAGIEKDKIYYCME